MLEQVELRVLPLTTVAMILVGVLLLGPTPVAPQARPEGAAPPPVRMVAVEKIGNTVPVQVDGYRDATATAYCDFGLTKSGVLVAPGIVAADPRVYPLGSVIEVRAGRYSGIYTVLDTGSAVKGPIIDIFIPNYEEAVRFGRRKVQVRVIRHGWAPRVSQTAG